MPKVLFDPENAEEYLRRQDKQTAAIQGVKMALYLIFMALIFNVLAWHGC